MKATKYLFTLAVSILFPIGINIAQDNCVYTVNSKDITVKWTAYKTPAKAPASGTFKDIKFKGKMKGATIFEASKGITATINPLTVNTDKPERDKKIADFFFKPMKKRDITVKTVNATDKGLEIEINMNGYKTKLVMETKIENDTLIATGVIDVLNFGLADSLKSLALACKALHEDKTWPDVSLELAAKFEKKCQ